MSVSGSLSRSHSQMLNMRIYVMFVLPGLRFGLGIWSCTCVFVWTLTRHNLCLRLFFSVVGHC